MKFKSAPMMVSVEEASSVVNYIADAHMVFILLV